MKKNIMLVVLLASAFAFSATAKKNINLKSMALPALPNFVLSTDGANSEAYKSTVQKKLNESQKANRHIAQTDTMDEKAFLSPSFIKVRNQFLAVQSPEQLDGMITELSVKENFDKLDRDGQFLALQFIALKPYKSFIFRAKTYLGTHTAIRSGIITSLKSASVAQQIFNQGAEQKALFDYVTTPMAGMGAEILTDVNMEGFMVNELMPAANSNYMKFSVLLANSDKPIHWDNKVYASFANFSDSADRYAQIGLPEQYLMLAGFEQSLAGLLMTSAYSLEGFSEMVNRMAKEFGVDSMNVLAKVDGLSAAKRFKILSQYPNLFQLKSNGAAYTTAAYGFVKASLQNTKLAWSYVNANQSGNSQTAFWLNGQNLLPFSRQINAGLSNFDNLFASGQLSSAVVNGEKININFEKIFTSPPQSLSQFYPTEFDNSGKTLTKTIGAQKYTYTNYKMDSATAWNADVFKVYLPDVKMNGNKTTNITRELRVLSQVWGANILGLSISGLVF